MTYRRALRETSCSAAKSRANLSRRIQDTGAMDYVVVCNKNRYGVTMS